MTRLQALAAAKKLCRTLGPNWEPRIWNNIEWHYSAELKGAPCAVYTTHDNTRYFCQLGDRRDCAGGSILWASGGEGIFQDPRTAVLYTLRRAKGVSDRIAEIVNDARVNAQLGA